MEIPGLVNQKVLITGGTKGLGKAIAIAFSKVGAIVFVTHKWGSVDEKDLCKDFLDANVKPPYIIQSDVSSQEDNLQLMKIIKEKECDLDIVVSNVAFSQIIQDISNLKRKTLELSINYSAWPMVDLILGCKEVFDYYPKYVLAISSDGADVCHPGYEMAGVSKAVLETLCKYLALRLEKFGSKINALRPGMMVTDSSTQTFGEEVIKTLYHKRPELFVAPEELAKVCLALCSGLMDSVNGQIITVDNGSSVISPISYLTDC
ncbi:3-oxoacyl-ACP reductase [Legionella antarctica]|uniref:3-oxoacyl-ACP reductase n=1 Tax=Legionella antarctica TaxID=2708020 RepID=A0A6F8T883_9GAMM|nr:SDR family oxidoreductase [Legionella antarctica]BCA96661.1 3-oxoacyl-ACP reductase [Legionella antarctica]